ncbi:hypothetical protein Tco_1212385 [Tanacetum coccineum]
MEIYHRFEETLRPLNPIPLVGVKEPEGSDDYTEVTLDEEQCLCDHYIYTAMSQSAYTHPYQFLSYMEPLGTLLLGDRSVYACYYTLPQSEVGKKNLDITYLLERHLDTLFKRGIGEIALRSCRGIEETRTFTSDDSISVPKG